MPIIETSDADVSEAEDGSLAVIAETDEASMLEMGRLLLMIQFGFIIEVEQIVDGKF